MLTILIGVILSTNRIDLAIKPVILLLAIAPLVVGMRLRVNVFLMRIILIIIITIVTITGTIVVVKVITIIMVHPEEGLMK